MTDRNFRHQLILVESILYTESVMVELKSILWYAVLIGITSAYLILIAGVKWAKRRNLAYHSRSMIIACSLVGIWLVAYVSKQVLFGREHFGGTVTQYRLLYMPVFLTHMFLAVTTIFLGSYNLYTGLTRFWNGTGAGAMKAGVSRHRLLGKLIVWSFSGTMVTAYLVYLMLFIFFPHT
jgi:putative membrane protein